MIVYTAEKKKFELHTDDERVLGFVQYTNTGFVQGRIYLEDTFFELELIATGIWITVGGDSEKKLATVKVESGGTISIQEFSRRKKYVFRKSVNWKLRFSLFNTDGDELLSIIPSVNWKKESHDFNLQLNEDFEKECNPFLILQALHCANCSLSMMEGGRVPALVSF